MVKKGGVHSRQTRPVRRWQPRTMQLMVSLALFLTVFLSKGAFPERTREVGEQMLGVISADTDFRAAFAQLGSALDGKDSVMGPMVDFCVAVFAPAQPKQDGAAVPQVPSDIMDAARSTCQRFGVELEITPPAQPLPEQEAVQGAEEPELAVGDVVEDVSYRGDEPPKNYSMEWLYLGGLETVAPLSGTITSDYGYRVHPITDKYSFHSGLDIGASMGAPIAAFADGTVEYVGKADDYGLYLQIDHGNGVKSFYAHCSKLCVSKGDKVTAGQTIAKVGQTGWATGPHLHLEIKLDSLRLNPEYYLNNNLTEGA